MKTSEELALHRMLEAAAEYKASDLHLVVGSSPILRVDAKLVPLNDLPVLTPEFLKGTLDILLNEEQRKYFDREREIVAAYPYKNVRFRVNIFYQRGYVSASLRYIGVSIPLLKDFNFPPVVEGFTDLSRGLLIVSGPFGSGRSTTLSAMVEEINRKRQEYILTIEQPIEYLFVNAKSIIEQREVGRDTPSFDRALSSATQEDVNVVMASSLEDSEAIKTALVLASSGRLVMGAMNTDTAVKTIEHILSAFPDVEQQEARVQLSEILQGVISQRLVPRVGGGRVLVAEILVATAAARSVIREGNFSVLNNIIQTSRDEGMMSLDHSLAQYVKTGEVLLDEALKYAQDRQGVALRSQSL